MGQYQKMLQIVDTHTGGQPTRTVIAGIPRLFGSNMTEKVEYFKEHYEWIRYLMTSEPRGSSLTSVAVLTEPTDPSANYGVVYFEEECYMPMCGHNTIGVCTMLVDSGFVTVKEPVTEIVLETPAGLVHASVEVENGRAVSVSFKNIPCFAYATDLELEFEGKSLKFDISYGGNFYAIFAAADLGVEIKPAARHVLVEKVPRLLDLVNEKFKVVHPLNNSIAEVTHIQITDPLQIESNRIVSKNFVGTKPDSFDRSPCGTGTSARTALLYSKNIMNRGMILQHKSIIDSMCESRILEEVDVGGYRGIIPQIKGSAHITGFATLLVDPFDDKGYGFKVR